MYKEFGYVVYWHGESRIKLHLESPSHLKIIKSRKPNCIHIYTIILQAIFNYEQIIVIFILLDTYKIMSTLKKQVYFLEYSIPKVSSYNLLSYKQMESSFHPFPSLFLIFCFR